MQEVSARKRIWGWFFFDWASQPYHTLLVTFIFGPFFAGVAAEYYMSLGGDGDTAAAQAQTLWAWGMAIAGLLIAFGAPVMGAYADTSGNRRPWIILFSVMYVIGSAALWFTATDGSNLYWMLAFFAFGFIGAEYALIFINAQLPDLGTEQEIGQISGSGFAFGYLGGVIALFIMLLLFAPVLPQFLVHRHTYDQQAAGTGHFRQFRPLEQAGDGQSCPSETGKGPFIQEQCEQVGHGRLF